MKTIMCVLVICLALVGLSIPAFAEPSYVTGTIKMIRTGWNMDSFGIVMDDNSKNPANCPTPDGYVTEKTQPGYNTYYAAALIAFAEKAQVTIVIAESGCSLARPKIVGINLIR